MTGSNYLGTRNRRLPEELHRLWARLGEAHREASAQKEALSASAGRGAMAGRGAGGEREGSGRGGGALRQGSTPAWVGGTGLGFPM